MAKKILYQDNARRALERGMEIMVEAVSVTLGPKGRNVVLEKAYGSPQIVNDGVTIAKEINLPDHIENTGVSLIRQAASKTNDVAGDGTTTATVLAYAMVKEGLKNVAAGANPISIKLGMEKATQYLVTQINEFAQPVEDIQSIQHVASISGGNDNVIGSLIADPAPSCLPTEIHQVVRHRHLRLPKVAHQKKRALTNWSKYHAPALEWCSIALPFLHQMAHVQTVA